MASEQDPSNPPKGWTLTDASTLTPGPGALVMRHAGLMSAGSVSCAMTDEQARALGERWIAAGGVGFSAWRAGMLDNHGRRVVDSDAFSIVWTHYSDDLYPWPDLRDPATKGAALAVVRERFGCVVMLSPEYDYDEEEARQGPNVIGWRAVETVRWVTVGQGATEGEALVAALEAAPR